MTVLEVVPSLLRAALDLRQVSGSRPDTGSLRWLMVTGEALPADLCRWQIAEVPIVNAYGPTECWTTWAETVLCEIFADVLHVGDVHADDSFFALGGDSITAIQVVSRALSRGAAHSPGGLRVPDPCCPRRAPSVGPERYRPG